MAAAAIGDPLETVVHTRTIIDPFLGFKLNGRIGPKDTIASIYAMDDLAGEAAPGSPSYAHFTIVRYKHSIRQDGYLGGFLTGRFEGGAWNGVAGADGQVRLTPASQAPTICSGRARTAARRTAVRPTVMPSTSSTNTTRATRSST